LTLSPPKFPVPSFSIKRVALGGRPARPLPMS
jgi:hypothetical protein